MNDLVYIKNTKQALMYLLEGAKQQGYFTDTNDNRLCVTFKREDTKDLYKKWLASKPN